MSAPSPILSTHRSQEKAGHLPVPPKSGEGGPSSIAAKAQRRPHIVLVIPRGEAVRNFLYSDTLKVLKENARVTVLTVVYDAELLSRIQSYSDEIIPLKEYQAHPVPRYLRTVIENAHDRWLWSKV